MESVDIQVMLWVSDAWNIGDIHHELFVDGNDLMNGRDAACQGRHVAANCAIIRYVTRPKSSG
jgi:hypothetical protein